MTKIAIIGTHGTGKTTLAYRLCLEAKIRGKNAIVINETARSCPFPINQGSNLNGFTWMIGTQIAKEQLAVAHKSEFIVCDRSAIDHVAYLPYEPGFGAIYTSLAYTCSCWMETYDKIFWVIPSPDIKLVDDGIRCVDPEFQKQIHDNFKEVLVDLPCYPRIQEISSKIIFEDKLDSVISEVFNVSEGYHDRAN